MEKVPLHETKVHHPTPDSSSVRLSQRSAGTPCFLGLRMVLVLGLYSFLNAQSGAMARRNKPWRQLILISHGNTPIVSHATSSSV